MRKRSICLIGIVCLMLGVFSLSTTHLQARNKSLKIDYFYNNPCASCEVESEFYELFNKKVGDIKNEVSYELRLYNTFNTEGRSLFDKICQMYDIADDKKQMPFMLIGDTYLVGNEEIDVQLRDTFIEKSKSLSSDKLEEAKNLNTSFTDNKTSSEKIETDEEAYNLIYFYTTACEDCKKTKAFLNELGLSDSIEENQEKMESKVVVEARNISELQNTELINAYFEAYEVDTNEQKVPIIFYNGGYLSGYKAIENGLEDVIKEGEALGTTSIEPKGTIEKLSLRELPQVFLTGLVNGLNPCSISMLFLLLSLMTIGSDILKLGFTYIAGKVLTYLALGTLCYSFLATLDSLFFESIQNMITVIIVTIMLGLAAANLLDYMAAKEEKYHKIRMQLPTKLRQFNHQMIESFMKKSQSSYGLMGIFRLSMIVSAGEFLCTGQIYLATIIYLLKRTVSYDGITFTAFVIYVGAMVIPLCLIIILAYKGYKIFTLSEFVRKHMTKIKLLNALIFIAFAIMLLCL